MCYCIYCDDGIILMTLLTVLDITSNCTSGVFRAVQKADNDFKFNQVVSFDCSDIKNRMVLFGSQAFINYAPEQTHANTFISCLKNYFFSLMKIIKCCKYN